jgi:hypothetical protein
VAYCSGPPPGRGRAARRCTCVICAPKARAI